MARMVQGTMVPKILAIYCVVANENGIFRISDAEKKMRDVYPDYFRLYKNRFASTGHNLCSRNHIERILVDGFVAYGIYKIPEETYTQVKDLVEEILSKHG